jgi:cell wall-associated NlpC family hydrolase
MSYSRARLLGAVFMTCALPLHRAGAQSPLPMVLRGSHGPMSPSAGVAETPATVLPSKLAVGPGPVAPPNGVARRAAQGAAAQGVPHHDLAQPFSVFSASARSLRDSLVALARAQIGRRYILGGASPEHGFDCSGLVRYVMAALKIDLPRTAREQATRGLTVPRDTSQLRPGDLLMFGSIRHISHVGIYVGEGHFVQASSKAGRVVETPLIRPMVRGVKPWRGVRRVMPETEDDSTLVVPDMGPTDVRVDAG